MFNRSGFVETGTPFRFIPKEEREQRMLEYLKARHFAMTVREVAEVLHLSQREIYKLAATNRIPHFRIGASVRFDGAAVAVWLEEKSVMASAARSTYPVHPSYVKSRRTF